MWFDHWLSGERPTQSLGDVPSISLLCKFFQSSFKTHFQFYHCFPLADSGYSVCSSLSARVHSRKFAPPTPPTGPAAPLGSPSRQASLAIEGTPFSLPSVIHCLWGCGLIAIHRKGIMPVWCQNHLVDIDAKWPSIKKSQCQKSLHAWLQLRTSWLQVAFTPWRSRLKRPPLHTVRLSLGLFSPSILLRLSAEVFLKEAPTAAADIMGGRGRDLTIKGPSWNSSPGSTCHMIA